VRIFWWQGGIHIEPEGQRECEALAVLMENARFEKPDAPTMSASGTTAEGSGSELFELLAGHDIHKRPVTEQLRNKQSVVPVNIGLKVLQKPLRTHG
jgi:hypothetical protein